MDCGHYCSRYLHGSVWSKKVTITMGPIPNNYGAMRVCICLKRTPVNGASHQAFTPYTNFFLINYRN